LFKGAQITNYKATTVFICMFLHIMMVMIIIFKLIQIK